MGCAEEIGRRRTLFGHTLTSVSLVMKKKPEVGYSYVIKRVEWVLQWSQCGVYPNPKIKISSYPQRGRIWPRSAEGALSVSHRCTYYLTALTGLFPQADLSVSIMSADVILRA